MPSDQRPIAEVISIGDELTSGQRLDTNSQWLSQRLGEIGVRTLFHSTVGDDLDSNMDVFRIASERADIVISTGGLGPTADDLTRQALSEAFQRPLVLHPEAMQHIEGLFQRRKRAMPERNRVQAFFPEQARMIDNPHGTAPGIDMSVEGRFRKSRIFALPGVPSEMKQMWQETVLSRLRQEMGLGTRQLYYRSIKVFGIGESDVEARLPELISRQRYPRVGITVSQATITLRMVAEAESQEQCDALFSQTETEIQEALGDLIFGAGDDELPDVIGRLLADRTERLSVIEVGPASVIIPWLNQVHSASQILSGGLSIADPSDDELQRWRLRLDHESHGGSESATEAHVYLTLARGAREFFGSDWGLAVGPYPDPAELRSSKSIPTARWTMAVIGPNGQRRIRTMELGGHPDVLVDRLAKTGLDQLRREILGIATV